MSGSEELKNLIGEVTLEEVHSTTGHNKTTPESYKYTGPHQLKHLQEAQSYYQDKGYNLERVPWVVSAAAFFTTAPSDVRHYATLDGYLVASAEQGFIQRMLDGDAPRGLSQAFTPCFRDEKKHDKYHHPYFLKLELFNPECSKEALRNMLQDAVAFYETHLPVRVVKADNGLDIVTHNGLELGSYGMRELNYQGETYRWTYGTGCAEPRLSQALGEFRN